MGKNNNESISIILPTYNEAENITDLICEIELYIKNNIGVSPEFIVVDDDSPDRTWEIAQNYFDANDNVKVIRRVNQKGLASAIWTGIQAAKGNLVAWMDCDFSMPPFKLVELINKVHEGYDICVGSRFIKGGKDIRGPVDSWIAVILSRAMNSSISFLLGSSFKDYTSGFVVARREIFEKIKFQGYYGEYFIDFIFKARQYGYKIIEIPYYCAPRRSGISKTGSNMMDYISKGWKYILLTLRLKFRKN
ncbi:MAG: glycosyltransferase [Candidatus Omnitrophica bacterium]|nr:glycosyltransferase [Candidatus Omnitrophota bacterium]